MDKLSVLVAFATKLGHRKSSAFKTLAPAQREAAFAEGLRLYNADAEYVFDRVSRAVSAVETGQTDLSKALKLDVKLPGELSETAMLFQQLAEQGRQLANYLSAVQDVACYLHAVAMVPVNMTKGWASEMEKSMLSEINEFLTANNVRTKK